MMTDVLMVPEVKGYGDDGGELKSVEMDVVVVVVVLTGGRDQSGISGTCGNDDDETGDKLVRGSGCGDTGGRGVGDHSGTGGGDVTTFKRTV